MHRSRPRPNCYRPSNRRSDMAARTREHTDPRDDQGHGHRSSCAPTSRPNHVARIKELAREGLLRRRRRSTASSTASWRRPAIRPAPARGGSGKKLKAEFSKEPHVRGTVSMARATSPNSRRQPVLHLLRRRELPRRPVHGVGQGDLGHGERRQDQARRASGQARTRSSP